MPVFNGRPFLQAAVASVLAQSLPPCELIVVDDGSTDWTYEAAAREAERFPRAKVLRHRRNLGKTEAMVTGARAAETDYLVLFDADLQHSTEEVPRFLERLGQGWDIVCGRKVGAYEKAAVSSIYNPSCR